MPKTFSVVPIFALAMLFIATGTTSTLIAAEKSPAFAALTGKMKIAEGAVFGDYEPYLLDAEEELKVVRALLESPKISKERLRNAWETFQKAELARLRKYNAVVSKFYAAERHFASHILEMTDSEREAFVSWSEIMREILDYRGLLEQFKVERQVVDRLFPKDLPTLQRPLVRPPSGR